MATVTETTERLAGLARELEEGLRTLNAQQALTKGGSFTKTGDQLVYTPVPTESDLQEMHVEAYRRRFDREVTVPKPGKALKEFLVITSDLGWPYKGHFIPTLDEVTLNSLETPLGRWYRENKSGIKDFGRGNLWVAVDTTRRPDYQNGTQVIDNYYLGPIAARLRSEGLINTKGYEHVPPHSLFAISHDEARNHVLPAVARPTRINEKWMRLLFAEEANFLGNLFYPHFGEANIWEWYWNRFGDDDRLIGGHADDGGLADVYYYWSDGRSDSVSLRPLADFSSGRA